MDKDLGTFVLGSWEQLVSMNGSLLARVVPHPFACPAAVATALAAVTLPALYELAARGRPFRGASSRTCHGWCSGASRASTRGACGISQIVVARALASPRSLSRNFVERR